MSIWTAEKDPSVKQVVVLLQTLCGENAFEIDFTTPTDTRAVYLNNNANSDMRAYLFTVAQKEGRYGVHLEFPIEFSSSPMESYENLSIEALIEILSVHLDLVPK